MEGPPPSLRILLAIQGRVLTTAEKELAEHLVACGHSVSLVTKLSDTFAEGVSPSVQIDSVACRMLRRLTGRRNSGWEVAIALVLARYVKGRYDRIVITDDTPSLRNLWLLLAAKHTDIVLFRIGMITATYPVYRLQMRQSRRLARWEKSFIEPISRFTGASMPKLDDDIILSPSFSFMLLLALFGFRGDLETLGCGFSRRAILTLPPDYEFMRSHERFHRFDLCPFAAFLHYPVIQTPDHAYQQFVAFVSDRSYVLLMLTRDDKLEFDYKAEVRRLVDSLRSQFPDKLVVVQMHPKQTRDKDLIGFVESLADYVLYGTRMSNHIVLAKADLAVTSYSTSFYEVLQADTLVVTYGNRENPTLVAGNFAEENPNAHAQDLGDLDALLRKLRDPEFAATARRKQAEYKAQIMVPPDQVVRCIAAKIVKAEASVAAAGAAP